MADRSRSTSTASSTRSRQMRMLHPTSHCLIVSLAAAVLCGALGISPSALQAQQASQGAMQPANVTYAGGRLSVSAHNSSLHQILRDISRATGMRVTGDVDEERVFGSYGPATPLVTVSALLEGTGSNVLLVHSSPNNAAMELVLTPRRKA